MIRSAHGFDVYWLEEPDRQVLERQDGGRPGRCYQTADLGLPDEVDHLAKLLWSFVQTSRPPDAPHAADILRELYPDHPMFLAAVAQVELEKCRLALLGVSPVTPGGDD